MDKKIKKQILTFSEYRVKNALFIQERLNEMNSWIYNGITIEYKIAGLYNSYLYICGINTVRFFDNLRYWIDRDSIDFDIVIKDNLVDVLDHVLDKDYLYKKYKVSY